MIDFILDLKDSKTIKVYDVTSLNESLPLNIYKYTLNIISDVVPNGIIKTPLDILSYMYTQRIQSEIYTIKSEHLGLAVNQDIPDGVYKFIYTLNTYKKENTFLIFNSVKLKVEELISKANYNIDISDIGPEYIKDYCDDDWDIKNIRYAKVLLEHLESMSLEIDVEEANSTLDKLNKLLAVLMPN